MPAEPSLELSRLDRSDHPGPALLPSPRAGGVIGEAAALAPDTFVVPGWRPVPGTELGLQAGTLVVRGTATAIVDTGLAGLATDWLNAVLSLVDPADVRWIVLTGDGPAHTGGLDALLAVSPDATVVALDGRQGRLDLGDRTLHLVTDGAGHPAVAVPDRAVVWADLVSGAFAEPTPDLAAASDDDLLAALAHRSHPPDAGPGGGPRRPRPPGARLADRAHRPRALGGPGPRPAGDGARPPPGGRAVHRRPRRPPRLRSRRRPGCRPMPTDAGDGHRHGDRRGPVDGRSR